MASLVSSPRSESVKRPRHPALAALIYVIRSEPGPVKVGVAKAPRSRLSELRVASAVPLALAFAAEVEGDAYAVEKRAHSILAQSRLRGEWFGVEVHETIAAVDQAAQDLQFALVPPGTTRTGECRFTVSDSVVMERPTNEGYL